MEQRRYRSRHLIPMFIWTPCSISYLQSELKNSPLKRTFKVGKHLIKKKNIFLYSERILADIKMQKFYV